jgi:hypothetical protein
MQVDVQKILVLDNTPHWLITQGQQDFKFFRFLSHHYGDPAKPDSGWLFGCILFDINGAGWFNDSPMFSYVINEYISRHVIPSIDETAQIKTLVRVRVNGMTSSNRVNLHTDSSQSNCWTVLYYVNDSSGTTDIFDENKNLVQSVEAKAGRMLIFPANYLHTANPPDNISDWRITLNFNYIVEGSFFSY